MFLTYALICEVHGDPKIHSCELHSMNTGIDERMMSK